METIDLNQLEIGEDGSYLLGGNLFSGFAIETFDDGKLRTQMSLMRGLEDGITRRWDSNRQLQSEKSFRDGAAHGRHQEWHADGLLATESKWNAGECTHERRFDEQARRILEMYRHPASQPRSATYQYYDIGEAGGSTDDPQSVIDHYDKDGNRIPDAADGTIMQS